MLHKMHAPLMGKSDMKILCMDGAQLKQSNNVTIFYKYGISRWICRIIHNLDN